MVHSSAAATPSRGSLISRQKLLRAPGQGWGGEQWRYRRFAPSSRFPQPRSLSLFAERGRALLCLPLHSSSPSPLLSYPVHRFGPTVFRSLPIAFAFLSSWPPNMAGAIDEIIAHIVSAWYSGSLFMRRH